MEFKEAKKHFDNLIKDMEDNHDSKNIDHVKKSLQAICPPSKASGASEDPSSLDPIFANIAPPFIFQTIKIFK